MANLQIDPSDYEALVEQLGDPIRAKEAYRHLVRGGAAALGAVRVGLAHPSGDVRLYCVRALDRLVDEDSWPEVIGTLGDNDPRVRLHALHALACDRCKDDVRPPVKADVLPRAIELLQEDPFYHVRQMAVEVVARWVHEDDAAARALALARDEDESAAVRKKAGWNAPGGTIYRKALPRPRRRA
jgi:HEAT repeat protein